MIHVECTYINPKTFKIVNSVSKTFNDPLEFNKFYSDNKNDSTVFLCVMYYDPYTNALKKDLNDARFLTLTKENPV